MEAIDIGHRVVTREEWLGARKAHLAREKEFTRQRDALSRERRDLPWVKVETNYVFEGPEGSQTLADLFWGRSQLIIYHFMFGPEWEEGCPYCSFLTDHIDGSLVHLEHHDVSLVVGSRARFPQIEAFKRRMDGASSGCRRSAATSTTTFMSRSQGTRRPTARYTTITNWANSSPTNFQVSACSTRTNTGTSFTPIQLTRAEARC